MGATILWTLMYLVPVLILALAIWAITRWMRAGSADRDFVERPLG